MLDPFEQSPGEEMAAFGLNAQSQTLDWMEALDTVTRSSREWYSYRTSNVNSPDHGIADLGAGEGRMGTVIVGFSGGYISHE